MKRLRLFFARVTRTIYRDPVMLSMLVVVVTFSIFSVIENIRANEYLGRVGDYKNSVKVQTLVGNIDGFTNEDNTKQAAYFCDQTVESAFIASQEKSVESLVQDIRRDVDAAELIAPRFSSAAVFLPQIQEARRTSGDLVNALDSLSTLAKENKKSSYCSALSEVFSETVFLKDLSGPEGVSALFVGQVENFWVNLENAKEGFRNISSVPAEFADEHARVNDIYNDFAVLLRGDTNDIDEFSSRVEKKLKELDVVFDRLRQKAESLRQISTEIQLTSIPLR